MVESTAVVPEKAEFRLRVEVIQEIPRLNASLSLISDANSAISVYVGQVRQ